MKKILLFSLILLNFNNVEAATDHELLGIDENASALNDCLKRLCLHIPTNIFFEGIAYYYHKKYAYKPDAKDSSVQDFWKYYQSSSGNQNYNLWRKDFNNTLDFIQFTYDNKMDPDHALIEHSCNDVVTTAYPRKQKLVMMMPMIIASGALCIHRAINGIRKKRTWDRECLEKKNKALNETFAQLQLIKKQIAESGSTPELEAEAKLIETENIKIENTLLKTSARVVVINTVMTGFMLHGYRDLLGSVIKK